MSTLNANQKNHRLRQGDVPTEGGDVIDLTEGALITGVSSGLGIYMAKTLANQGLGVAVLVRRMDKLLGQRGSQLHYRLNY